MKHEEADYVVCEKCQKVEVKDKRLRVRREYIEELTKFWSEERARYNKMMNELKIRLIGKKFGFDRHTAMG